LTTRRSHPHERPDEAGGDGAPYGARDEDHGEGGQEEQGADEEDPVRAPEEVLAASAQQDRPHRGREQEVAQRQHHRVIFVAGRAAEEERGRGGAAGERPARPAELEEVQARIGPGPEARVGRGAEKGPPDGLAGGQRVARHLGIERGLQGHGHGADPEKGGPMPDDHHRSEQPITRAEREAQQDRPRPDHA